MSEAGRPHEPMHPPPAGAGGPNIRVAFVPVGIIVSVASLGALFGKSMPTNATAAMLDFRAPATGQRSTAIDFSR